ncbi:MAG: cytochrome c-type biogenesis protein CcmH [Acidobacteria bacterium]|nr:cytochrome c-type biogenesis protein CcmH [Acidobacteriota bacterium]
MSERLRTLSALMVIGASLLISVAVLATDSTGVGDRVHSLAERLKCPICTSESVADSPSQVARDLYDLIGEQVADGWTNDDIFEFFVATYGEEVLLDPRADGIGVVLWMAPLAALALGGAVIAGRRAGKYREISDAERSRIATAMEEQG